MVYPQQILDWFNVERVKAIAAIIQAFGFVAAALLTYRYTRKLETEKFEMRLKEIMHANTHKRKMESFERISNLMGIVIFKLSTVPPFIPDLDPVPLKKEEESLTDWTHKRTQIKFDRLNEAHMNLMEAVEEGYIYVNQSIFKSLGDFREDIEKLLSDYFSKHLDLMKKGEAMGQFKKDVDKVKELRRSIVTEFRKQLHP